MQCEVDSDINKSHWILITIQSIKENIKLSIKNSYRIILLQKVDLRTTHTPVYWVRPFVKIYLFNELYTLKYHQKMFNWSIKKSTNDLLYTKYQAQGTNRYEQTIDNDGGFTCTKRKKPPVRKSVLNGVGSSSHFECVTTSWCFQCSTGKICWQRLWK